MPFSTGRLPGQASGFFVGGGTVGFELVLLAIAIGVLLGHGGKAAGYKVAGKQIDPKRAAEGDFWVFLLMAVFVIGLIIVGGGTLGGVAIGGFGQ